MVSSSPPLPGSHRLTVSKPEHQVWKAHPLLPLSEKVGRLPSNTSLLPYGCPRAPSSKVRAGRSPPAPWLSAPVLNPGPAPAPESKEPLRPSPLGRYGPGCLDQDQVEALGRPHGELGRGWAGGYLSADHHPWPVWRAEAQTPRQRASRGASETACGEGRKRPVRNRGDPRG